MKSIELKPRSFEGAVSFETGDGWIRPWRLPFEQIQLFTPDTMVHCGADSAGVRLRLRTDSSNMALTFLPYDGELPHQHARAIDLTIDGQIAQSCPIEIGQDEVVFENLPSAKKTVEIWLPQNCDIRLRELRIDEGAEATIVPDQRLRWTTYGSSITHCKAAHSPGRTWPATAARMKALNLTCLGYGGNCHLDPMIAMTIRDTPADFISLKVGINIMGGESLGHRMFRPALIGFVRIIRERHPDTPIAIVSPIISPDRETKPNKFKFTLQTMRQEIADAVQRFADCDDANVHYFDGTEVFGEDLVEDYLPDRVHPNGDGYEVLGHKFAETVLSKLIPQVAGCK